MVPFGVRSADEGDEPDLGGRWSEARVCRPWFGLVACLVGLMMMMNLTQTRPRRASSKRRSKRPPRPKPKGNGLQQWPANQDPRAPGQRARGGGCLGSVQGADSRFPAVVGGWGQPAPSRPRHPGELGKKKTRFKKNAKKTGKKKNVVADRNKKRAQWASKKAQNYVKCA